MKIGIPRALLYYYYYPFFRTLFEKRGCEVIISDETNSSIISEGGKVTVSELCVPIKIFNGHILNLMEKNVDYIFVPEFIQLKKEWYCPKFLGIKDLARYSIDGLSEKLLAVEIRTKSDKINEPSIYYPILDKINATKKQLKTALKAATEQFDKLRELSKSGYTMLEAFDIIDGKEVKKKEFKSEIKLGFMGYVNNIYDNFVSMNAIEKLREMDVSCITFDMLEEKITDYTSKRGKMPYWVFARKIYYAAEYLVENKLVDGIIHMTAFGCGPDSIIGKMMEILCDEHNIPFMTLRVDEHTGESHVQTRLEAFVDMLKN